MQSIIILHCEISIRNVLQYVPHRYTGLYYIITTTWGGCPPSLSIISTLNPPCDQSLAAVEVGAGVLIIVPSLLLTWPLAPEIPPASSSSQWGGGARVSQRCFGGGGGGCCPVTVMWPLAPTIHPASSCSQWWGWVLMVVAYH